MQSGIFRDITLRTKAALAVSALFILFVVTASYFTFAYFERKFKESISIQQLAHITSLANAIDDKLSIAQNALISVAEFVPQGTLTDAEKAQRCLDFHTGIQSIFDNVSFISADGKLIAETRYISERRGKDLSYREWYRRTIAGQKPFISNPYVSTHPPFHPCILITVPIFDTSGHMAGMLAGIIDLLGKNFLADLSKARIGSGGYLYITDYNRTMIVHPDRNRIMKLAASPGANKLYDQALKGFEGSGETVNTYGTPMLASFKHLRMTSWILGCNYPISEAYAPLETARRYFYLTAVAVTAVMLFITWLIIKRLMSPLAAITRHLEHIQEKQGEERLIFIDSSQEISVLTTAFNSMISALDKQQGTLLIQKNSIEHERSLLQAIMDAIPDMMFYKDRNSIYQRCNESFASLFVGMPKDRIIGRSDYDFDATAEKVELYRQSDQEVVLHGKEIRHDVWITLANGQQILIEALKVPFRNANGDIVGVIGVCRDITERTLAEDKLHEQAVQLEQEIADRQEAQERLKAKQIQLEALNNSLSGLVEASVKDLRKKDTLLIQQSRQAAMGEMINNIAHQWRQPLNTIGLIIQNLRLSFEMGRLAEDEIKTESDLAMDTLQFLSRTIDDFRNFFRKDKEKQPFSVGKALDTTLNFVFPNHKDKMITLDVETRDTAPAFGYPNEYSQVLLNILNNAKDVLMERQIVEPCIRIRVSCEEGRSVVKIRDNGGGIADDILPRIFDPYFSTKTADRGTGIGLYMSKTIIEQNMGGALSACNINGGAEFTIEIPSSS
jgi:PAS domain S-box-containing protein